jgi:tetratricopeptide (TPR) repeat protein
MISIKQSRTMTALIFLTLLLLLPGAAPAQTEDLDPVTRLERDLAGLDEEGVYRKAEALNLGGGSYDLTRRAYQEILNRFSTGPRAPKAAFQLAILGLRNARNWDQSIGKLVDASRAYPDSSLGRLAADYHEALTAPKNAYHIELLADLFHRGHLVARGPGMSYQGYVDFVVMLVSRTFKEKPVLDWIVADTGLTDQDRSLLAYDVADMLYRAAAFEVCKTVCEWIVKQYPDEAEANARALVLLGHMRWMYAKDRDGAEQYFRQAAEKSSTSDLVPEAFWSLAENHLGAAANPGKAKALLEEVRTKWPKSEWSVKARQMRCRGDLVSLFGQPTSATPDEEKWQALRKWEANPLEALPEGLEDVHLAKFCGPWSVRRVCGQLGVALTPAEAMRRCPSKPGGISSLGDLTQAFEASGLKVTAQEMGMEEMRALAAQPGKKLILHMPRHFMVVESVDEKGIVLSDATNPSYRISFERLAIYWDGYLLCVEK